jgi:hypothetical protein
VKPEKEIHYMPRHWYWRVGADAGRVYSSETVGYVFTDNPDYLKWLARNEQGPTKIANEQELWNVLAEAKVDLPSGAAASDDSKDRQIESMHQLTLAVLLDQENRMRARGTPPQPPLDMAGFKQLIKGII